MHIVYDPDADVLQITFSQRAIEETAPLAPGLVLDYDGDGQVIGLEIRKASTRVDNPRAIAYQLGAMNRDKPQPKE